VRLKLRFGFVLVGLAVTIAGEALAVSSGEIDQAFRSFDGLSEAIVDSVSTNPSGRTVSARWGARLLGAMGAKRVRIHSPRATGCESVTTGDTLFLPWNGNVQPSEMSVPGCLSRFRRRGQRMPSLPFPVNDLTYALHIEGQHFTVTTPAPAPARVRDDRPVHNVLVAEARNGTFYWFGHRLRPPFEFRAAFRVGAETTLVATYLDTLPLYVVQPKEAPRKIDVEFGRSVPQTLLLRRAGTGFTAAMDEGLDLQARIDRMADTLRLDPALVDSVIVDGHSMEIHWRGEDGPDGRGWRSRDHSLDADPWKGSVGQLRDHASLLDRGSLIVWFGGHNAFLHDLAAFERSIDLRRRGIPTKEDHWWSEQEWDQLLHPPPIAELVRRMSPP